MCLNNTNPDRPNACRHRGVELMCVADNDHIEQWFQVKCSIPKKHHLLHVPRIHFDYQVCNLKKKRKWSICGDYMASVFAYTPTTALRKQCGIMMEQGGIVVALNYLRNVCSEHEMRRMSIGLEVAESLLEVAAPWLLGLVCPSIVNQCRPIDSIRATNPRTTFFIARRRKYTKTRNKMCVFVQRIWLSNGRRPQTCPFQSI